MVNPAFQKLLSIVTLTLSKNLLAEGYSVTIMTFPTPVPDGAQASSLLVVTFGKDDFPTPIVVTQDPAVYDDEKLREFGVKVADGVSKRIKRALQYPNKNERFVERVDSYGKVLCKTFVESGLTKAVHTITEVVADGDGDFSGFIDFELIAKNGASKQFRIDVDEAYITQALYDDALLEPLSKLIVAEVLEKWSSETN